MDGTLIDNMRFHTEAWRQLIEENGHEFNERKFLVETAGQTNREIIPTVFGDISEDRLTELALRKEDLYRERYLPHRKPLDGLIDFLDRSRSLGIKLGVATAASPRNMEFILDGLDLRKYFDTLTTAADVKRGKPDPEIFLLSAERLNADTANCIVFEDAFGGFEAAKRAGMTAIGLTTVNSAEDIIATGNAAVAYANFTGLDPAHLADKYLKKTHTTDPNADLRLRPINIDEDNSSDIYSSDECQQLISMYSEFYPKVGFTPPWIGYFILRQDKVVGSCGFVGKPKDGKVEVAYWTFKEFEGQGVASFACRELISIAAETQPDATVTAKTAPEKNASTAILEKNDFIFSGIVQDDEIGDAWFWTHENK